MIDATVKTPLPPKKKNYNKEKRGWMNKLIREQNLCTMPVFIAGVSLLHYDFLSRGVHCTPGRCSVREVGQTPGQDSQSRSVATLSH